MMGQGLAPCPFASEGLVEGNPAQLQLLRGAPGRGGLALGHCCCSRLQALSQPSRRRKPYPLQVPCSHHGASCLNLVPAPCTPPMLLPKGGTPPSPCWCGTEAGAGLAREESRLLVTLQQCCQRC